MRIFLRILASSSLLTRLNFFSAAQSNCWREYSFFKCDVNFLIVCFDLASFGDTLGLPGFLDFGVVRSFSGLKSGEFSLEDFGELLLDCDFDELFDSGLDIGDAARELLLECDLDESFDSGLDKGEAAREGMGVSKLPTQQLCFFFVEKLYANYLSIYMIYIIHR